jgi:hypothetical protein
MIGEFDVKIFDDDRIDFVYELAKNYVKVLISLQIHVSSGSICSINFANELHG